LGTLTGWLYVAACIVVPCAVGGAMFLVFEVWDRARHRASGQEPLPHVDYWI
jgi:hypothetical protein